MKKFLVALLVSMSPFVHAEQWVDISRSVDDVLLSADIDTLELSMVENVGVVAFGIMRYTGKEYLPPFGAVISVKECVDQGKGTLINVFGDNTSQQQRWSADGKAMYDAQGQFLCGFSKEVLRARQPPKIKDVRPGRKYLT